MSPVRYHFQLNHRRNRDSMIRLENNIVRSGLTVSRRCPHCERVESCCRFVDTIARAIGANNNRALVLPSECIPNDLERVGAVQLINLGIPF